MYDKMTNAEKRIQRYLEMIIANEHDRFEPLNEELILDIDETGALKARTFLHDGKTVFRIFWKVYNTGEIDFAPAQKEGG